MMIIPNSRFQRETGQTEAVKQTEKTEAVKQTEKAEAVKQTEKAEESKATVDVEKSENSQEAQKPENILVRHKAFDQYMPEKEGEEKSYGHYEMVSDKEGHSKVQFDNPDKSLKEKAAVDQVEERNDSILNQGQKLQKLKKKKQQLKQKIKSETDPGKSEELKRKLAQIEQEIKAEKK